MATAGPGDERLRVLLVASGGGHLGQLLPLAPWLARHDRSWVTFEGPGVALLGNDAVTFAHQPTTRNIPNLVRNTFLAWRMLRSDRPDVVISSGAGPAVPFFLIARMLGIRTVFIEVYDRIDTRSLTGRLCHPLSDLFLVQWEQQKELYGRATVIGGLHP